MVHERLEPLDRSLELLHRWQQERSGGQFRDTLDQSAIELFGLVRDFPEADLRQFAQDGHRGRLEISRGAWSTVVSIEPGGSFVIEDVAGPIDEAFPDEAAIQEVQAAKDEGRATDLLLLSNELDCRAELTLQNRALQSGFHWVRTTDTFIEHAKRQTWLALVAAVYANESPRRLVVHDAGNAHRMAADLLLHGAQVFPEAASGNTSEAGREYKETWLHDERADLPPPVWVYPLGGEGLESLVAFFAGAAYGLSWLWLASSARLTSGMVVIHFEGAPDLDFDMTILPDCDRAAEVVRLWEWAVATTDPARYEAIQQAVSLVLRDPAMLDRSAERVLRTAKYLLRLSRQGTIAEALAIRRSARQAAITAAQGTAEASRVATRSVVDRVLAQLVGAFGVLLANHANLINQTVTGWLLAGLLGLTIATALVAFRIEFPAASGALEAFETDLEGYSDMLIEEDIDQIRSMKSLEAAKTQLTRAVRVAAILVVLAALALIIARFTI
jgi:hypothetical protein